MTTLNPTIPRPQPPGVPAPDAGGVHRRSGLQRLLGLSPFGPIFALELRSMARRKRSYLLRVVYLGVLLLCLLLAYSLFTDVTGRGAGGVVQQAQRQAEMGHVFFVIFAFFSIIAMALIAPVLTCNAIGGERLRRTFDVLVMTPLTSWQIVAGKLSSRLLAAFTLIGLSLPVLAIVRLLGGIELDSLVGVLALTAAFTLSNAALGLFCSTFFKRSYNAILAAYLIEGLIYLLLPFLGLGVLSGLKIGPQFGVIAGQVMLTCNPFGVIAVASTPTMFYTPPWISSIAVQVGFAGLLLLISARRVRHLARETDASPKTAPDPGTRQSIAAIVRPPDGTPKTNATAPLPPAAGPPPLRASTAPPPHPPRPVGVPYATPILPAAFPPAPVTRPPRTVGDNPVLWRELRRAISGKRWLKIVAGSLAVTLLLLTYLMLTVVDGLNKSGSQIGYALVFDGILLLLSCVFSATAIAAEKESDTWTLLCATPLTGWQIVIGKLAGVYRRLFWPIVFVVGHFLLFTLTGVLSWTSLAVICFIGLAYNAVWVATGLYLSLRLKKVTTAVVVNLLLPVLLYAGVPILLAVAAVYIGNNAQHWSEATLYYLPFWYLGEYISRFKDTTSLFSGGISHAPVTQAPVDQATMLIQITLSGLIQLALAAALLAHTAYHFNRIAGRARTMK